VVGVLRLATLGAVLLPLAIAAAAEVTEEVDQPAEDEETDHCGDQAKDPALKLRYDSE